MIFAALILLGLIVGTFLGHWSGYTKAEVVGRRRLAHTLASGPRYSRVGSPE